MISNSKLDILKTQLKADILNDLNKKLNTKLENFDELVKNYQKTAADIENYKKSIEEKEKLLETLLDEDSVIDQKNNKNEENDEMEII